MLAWVFKKHPDMVTQSITDFIAEARSEASNQQSKKNEVSASLGFFFVKAEQRKAAVSSIL